MRLKYEPASEPLHISEPIEFQGNEASTYPGRAKEWFTTLKPRVE